MCVYVCQCVELASLCVYVCACVRARMTVSGPAH